MNLKIETFNCFIIICIKQLMGVPNLNAFLLEKCSDIINKKHLSHFSGKTIVIDTSIYLYKYVGQNKMVENFYLLISIFKHYNIVPIFIFDGKPPNEKKDLLKKRKIDKNEAENKYNIMFEKLNNPNLSNIEKKDINTELEKLKKQFIRIHINDINIVKNIMDLYGVEYYDAPGEADYLCAKLVINGIADACLSDDMDLIVFGCNKVLRYLSILNHSVILYDVDEILKKINLTIDDLRKIVVLSGTDYNMKSHSNLNQSLQYYSKFKKDKMEDFFEWLNVKKNIKIEELNDILKMFQIENHELETFERLAKNENKSEMFKLLDNYGFIFI